MYKYKEVDELEMHLVTAQGNRSCSGGGSGCSGGGYGCARSSGCHVQTISSNPGLI